MAGLAIAAFSIDVPVAVKWGFDLVQQPALIVLQRLGNGPEDSRSAPGIDCAAGVLSSLQAIVSSSCSTWRAVAGQQKPAARAGPSRAASR